MFTGHSLGREKRRRLIDAGLDPRQIEEHYAMARRIDAEELALAHCNLVVTSTRQELEVQYARYGRFCAKQAKPPVLAICRADHRKNIPALVEVFGRSERLRRQHNLVLLLGCRYDPRQLEKQQREVFQQGFELVDRFDLYGQVAYPKQHERHQIPSIYRWASRLGGVFVNPASPNPSASPCGPAVGFNREKRGRRRVPSACWSGSGRQPGPSRCRRLGRVAPSPAG